MRDESRPIGGAAPSSVWRAPLAWFTVWLLALDLLLRLFQGPIYSIWWLGPIESYRQTADLVLPAGAPVPRIVVFGSSETREAIAPYVLESTLGLQRGEVVNMGVRIARPSDMLEQYRFHRDLIGHAELVLVGLEEWHLNAYTERIPDARFRYRAGLRERATFPVPSILPELLVGYVWTTWDMRSYFFQLASNTALYRTPRGPPQYRDDIGRTVPGEPQPAVPWSPELDRFYASSLLRNYTVWDREARAVSDLAQLTKEDGAALVFVQFPKRRSYLDEAERTFGAAHELWLRTVAASAPGVPYADLRAPESFGLDAADFLDHIHLSHRGSELFTRRFAERLVRTNGRFSAVRS